MVQNYLATLLNDSEIDFIQAQYCGRDADELIIIKVTAELLGIQIWITNKHSSSAC